MADDKPVLVLHLATGGDPLFFAIPADDRAELERKLHLLIEHGSTESVRTQEGSRVSVNFGHVAVAYIDDMQRKGKVFGLH